MLGLEKLIYCPRCGSSRFVANGQKSRRCEDCQFEWFENAAAANVAFIINGEGQLLVARRRNNPAKGTLDLPGGFCDAGETAEQAVCREVLEETNLVVSEARYLFSLPNVYHFSGIDIPTLDMFFACKVDDFSPLQARDDAESCFFVPIEKLQTELFGLNSIRQGLERYLKEYLNR